MHINHLPTRSFHNYVDMILPYFDHLPTSTHVDLFYLGMWSQKRTFFDHLPTPFCLRSYSTINNQKIRHRRRVLISTLHLLPSPLPVWPSLRDLPYTTYQLGTSLRGRLCWFLLCKGANKVYLMGY